MVSSSYAEGSPDRVHYEGLQTCGSVWTCPCCGARISETRREEMNELLAWARAQGYRVKMLTLTARHGRDDDLAELLERMKDAKQRWARHRAYRRIKPHMIGSVTATEVTGGGAHGWHPHFHVIVILDGDVDLSSLRDAWLASLRGAGLDGTGAGWDIRSGDEAGRYVAKWGAAEELALKDRKKGRAGRTPAQLLAASCDEGDRRAGYLWAEYARVFHGRRQLVWSRGLKALAGVGEVDDQEAAQDQQQDGQIETGRANIPHAVWRGDVATRGADRRAELLDRAEEVGPDQAAAEVVEQGLPDRDVLEDPDPPPYQPPPGGIGLRIMAEIYDPETGECFSWQPSGTDRTGPELRCERSP
ncbi:protein rep [Phaeobacter italicus]|uniref:protein rep n=2 Tax=Phaeobacter italicus TaxID=481446 RepID=UPI002FDAECE4